jgi:hypothetical protein
LICENNAIYPNAQILHLVNLLLCGFFSRLYNDLNRKYKFVMHLVDVYGPFAFFKGWYEINKMMLDHHILVYYSAN